MSKSRTTTREPFGTVVATMRANKGMTPYALAQTAGLPPDTVYRIEAGKRTYLDVALKIAAALGTTLGEIERRMMPVTLPSVELRARGRPKNNRTKM